MFDCPLSSKLASRLENMLLNSEFKLLLADFGNARTIRDANTPFQGLRGSKKNIAPGARSV